MCEGVWGVKGVAAHVHSSFLLEGKSLCICAMQSATICSSEREKARSSKTACTGMARMAHATHGAWCMVHGAWCVVRGVMVPGVMLRACTADAAWMLVQGRLACMSEPSPSL